MSRPPLEVADLVRAAGDAFIERSRKWITWKHVKVLLAIARCRTAALGGHLDECTRCGHRAISYNSCIMGSFFLWGAGTAKGYVLHGATPFGLSIKAWPSEGLAICQAVGTCPCEGLAARPPR
jgi:Transposase zinc-binding domain